MDDQPLDPSVPSDVPPSEAPVEEKPEADASAVDLSAPSPEADPELEGAEDEQDVI